MKDSIDNRDVLNQLTPNILNEEVVVEKINTLDNIKPYPYFQSAWHFSILCLLSFNVYSLFWFFKHWQYLKEEKGFNINASFRSGFGVLYGYSLFKEYEILAIKNGYKKQVPIFILFIILIIIQCTGFFEYSVMRFFSIFSFVPLIPIHNMMNYYYIKAQPTVPIKTKLSKGEKTFLITIWSSLIIGVIIVTVLNS